MTIPEIIARDACFNPSVQAHLVRILGAELIFLFLQSCIKKASAPIPALATERTKENGEG